MSRSVATRVAVEHLNVAGVTEELDFKFFVVVVNLNLNSHMGLLDPVLDNTGTVGRGACVLLGFLCLSPPKHFPKGNTIADSIGGVRKNSQKTGLPWWRSG